MANQYTTKWFSLTPTAQDYSHRLTFMEAAICSMLEDKPKEFIMAIRLVVQNAKYIESHFGLAPLKSNPSKPSKIIMAEADVPYNFTHIGQYAFTSGNRIFEKKKNWKKDKDSKLIAMMQMRTSMIPLCTSPLQSPPTFNPTL